MRFLSSNERSGQTLNVVEGDDGVRQSSVPVGGTDTARDGKKLSMNFTESNCERTTRMG